MRAVRIHVSAVGHMTVLPTRAHTPKDECGVGGFTHVDSCWHLGECQQFSLEQIEALQCLAVQESPQASPGAALGLPILYRGNWTDLDLRWFWWPCLSSVVLCLSNPHNANTGQVSLRQCCHQIPFLEDQVRLHHILGM